MRYTRGMQLSATDYGNFLANELLPLSTSKIAEKSTNTLVDEFKYISTNSTEPLSTFLDYITYAYMIDNVILLITGTLHGRDTHELLERCHPLGKFDAMSALCVATNVEELYQSVLVETPLAPYFRNCLTASDLDDLNIEIIRNAVYKAYLEDFHAFAQTLEEPTASIMTKLLAFEADRRAINITLNSFGTELTKEMRSKLYPEIGRLYPAGTNVLARADDFDQVRAACESIPEYHQMFDGISSNSADNDDNNSLEDRFFAHEVLLNKETFLQQFNYAPFYSYFKLKEQEVRNIVCSPISVDPFTLVGKELKGLTGSIKLNLGSNLKSLDTLSKYYFEAQGKHLRPTIVLLMAQATAGLSPHYNASKDLKNVLVNDPLAPQSILNDNNPSFHNGISHIGQDGILATQRRLAEIVEMIHVASLLHDDVVDDADTRRGAPSAPVKFGNKLTIFAGDFLLGRASIMLARLRSLEVAELIGATIANLVEGEVAQLNETYESKSTNTETIIDEAFERYLSKTYLKTASLISSSSRAAVCLGGVGINENWPEGEYLKDAAYEYGRNLGMAFQVGICNTVILLV
ncbi:vacuolar ATP synthase subunit D [Wallemia mellicola]|uniref:V-type proton ATPase subunit D n=1 Tax=Wallemia mellicola TaxID=1708541 RepID=A0AB74KGU5_9BASI|nr:vacuolar ATP synthase subunit D [Wallemia mellicola]